MRIGHERGWGTTSGSASLNNGHSGNLQRGRETAADGGTEPRRCKGPCPGRLQTYVMFLAGGSVSAAQLQVSFREATTIVHRRPAKPRHAMASSGRCQPARGPCALGHRKALPCSRLQQAVLPHLGETQQLPMEES